MLLGIRWGSLRTKIIAWVFVPTAIILGAVALVMYIAYQQVTEELVIERDRELIRLSASQLTTELKDYADLLTTEGRRADIHDKDPAIQREALRASRDRLAAFDAGVYYVNQFGQVLAAEPARPEVQGQSWADRNDYRQLLHSMVLGSPAAAFSDIVADGPGGANVVAVSVPVFGPQGEFAGLLVGMFRVGSTSVSALYDDIAQLRVGEKESVHIVDGTGRLIYDSDPGRIGDDLSGQEVVRRVLKGETNTIRTQDFEGHDIVASFAPVPGTPWGLITEESWKGLLGASQEYRGFLLALLALGVVVPVLVVGFGVRRVTRPIAEVIEAARKVAAGDFGQTISAHTGDETEELADQFNRMSAQLQESYAHLEQRVSSRTRELAALNAIATVVSQSLNLDEILNGALDTTLQVMEVEVGGIYLLDQAGQTLTIAAQRGLHPEFVVAIDRLQVGEGFSGRVAQSGQPLVVQDVSDDSRLTRMVVRDEGLHSLVIVPLSSKGQVLGTLFAMSHGYREFTSEDVQLLTSIGHQIGGAVESARLFKAEQRRAEQFRVIYQVGQQITSILDIDEILVQVVRLIQQSFGYDHVGIGLIEEGEVDYKVGAGLLWDDAAFDFRPHKLKVGENGISGWVAGTGEPLLIPDVSQEPRYVWMQGSNTRSELTVPIKAKGQVIGVLDVQSERLNAFDESDLTVIQSLASETAIAIENARLFRDTTRQVRELRALADASRIISSVLDQDQLLQSLYEQITRIAPTDSYLIALYDDATNVVSIEINVDEEVHHPHERYVLDKGLLKLIIHERQSLRFDNLSEERQDLGVEIGSADSPRASHSLLGVPMLYGDRVLGAIIVGSYQPAAFDEGHLQTLTSIANQAAVALENARLYDQARRLAVMEERQRLARELHDAVTQTLFSASLIAEALPDLWEVDQEEGRALLKELRQLSRGALAEMRTLLLELRPSAVVEASIGDLLQQLGEAVAGRTGAPVHVLIEGQCELPPDVHVALYRIAQEALNNVVKHARACGVEVLLRRTVSIVTDHEQRLRAELQVSDDGCGFDPGSIAPNRLGLSIIRERAEAIGARLTITSQPGHGTRITVVWDQPVSGEGSAG
jgi:nitrate/nitrite-specific signal transduction histidine kinase